ncbi:hypothetical protein MTBPR1_10073 [Candidatus Terasakiella magnetica]|uniref:Phage regulatory protein, Rha family n=1 Tax=Candidatus Terasakiella magnetica TaxID=1867952 RepID=A0A1C3RC14_9PROT|nr:Rha family transcriptional regulator [Candidatus Terasakiella magnetica]SCA54826.1 hypothetical protein MTBPR1_10073 [Candidatus Terasakiella magnetica]
MTNNALTPIVSVQDGTVFANSKDVANFFGKRHDNVMADIHSRMKSLSPEISGQWFQRERIAVDVGFGTKYVPTYNLTRDGFTFLVMKWTGEKATQFQVKYIQRFNEMEQELKSQVPAVPTSFAEALQLAADQANKIEQQDLKLIEQALVFSNKNLSGYNVSTECGFPPGGGGLVL